jgi:hypothetical protein
MSVMILEPAAIGQLVGWAEQNIDNYGGRLCQSFRIMACRIVEENQAAYDGLYNMALDESGPVEARRAYERYSRGIDSIDAAVIYQFAKSIEYQCCESPSWNQPGNDVREFLRRVKLKAADKMMYEMLGEDAALDAWAPDSLVEIGKKAAA